MISHHPPFVFVHIPRTGGTSVEVALAEYSHVPIQAAAHECTVLPFKHLSASQLRAELGDGWQRAFTFSTVRNPWARMLSDYSFFRAAGPALYPLFSERERQITDGALALDLEGWLQRYADVLQMCQMDYLCDDQGQLLVDKVCRLERLATDFAEVCAILGIQATLPRLNATAHPPLAEAYSPRSEALVRELCARDIAAFGYTFTEEASR